MGQRAATEVDELLHQGTRPVRHMAASTAPSGVFVESPGRLSQQQVAESARVAPGTKVGGSGRDRSAAQSMQVALKNRPSILRWMSIVSLGAIGACAFYASWAWLGRGGLLPTVSTSLRPWAVWLLTALFLGLVGRSAGWYVRMRVPADFTAGYRYPPLWLAVALALAIVCATNSLPVLSPLDAPITWHWDAFTISLAAVFGFTLLWPKRWPWQGERARAKATAPEEATEWASLSAWAEREAPAGPDQPDLFNHLRIARRLANRLRRPWGIDETVALLGPYGSGKTTLLNWLKAELGQATNPAIWTCQVNAWGLEKSANAPAYVLSRILETIDGVVDCQPLRGLPAAYQQLLSADPTGVAQRVAALVAPPDDPIEALHRLTPLLKASAARLVLLIEDIDRAGPDFHPEHVQRLLWHLRQVEGVAFVLAFDPERREDLDYWKVCDHVEVLPRLDADAVRGPLRLLRDHCLSTPRIRTSLITPASDHQRDPLDLHDSGSTLETYARRRYRNSPADAISVLVTTPRVLKHVVRRIARVWDGLQGEIDLDDVILMTVLRVGSPEAHAFLVAHLDAVREGKSGNAPGLTDAEKGRRLLERWNALRGEGLRAEAIQVIVDALALPRLATMAQAPRPQGVASGGPTDYFRRLLAEEMGENELRDQAVLADTAAYLRDDRAGMWAGLLNSTNAAGRYVEVWEHFSDLVPTERLQPLAEEIVRALVARDDHDATGEHPALLAAWRCCNRRLSPRPEHVDWLASLIRVALPVSMHLANDIYYYWASIRHGIVDQDGRQRVRGRWVADARSIYSAVGALCRALDPNVQWCLRRLVRPDDTEEPSSDVVDPSQWTWLAQPLLDGLAVDPALLLPEVVNLVGNFRSELRARDEDLRPETVDKYTLNRELITGVFGERASDLLRVLATSSGDSWAIGEARRQAADWLTDVTRQT